MRRSDHPNRPSAITCCFLSSLKTLLTLTQGNSRVRINVLDQTSVGRFSGDNNWPHLSDYRGLVYPLAPDHEIRALMNYGEWMSGEVVLKRMAKRQCHRKVAKLWLAEPRKLSAVGMGYALSDDGLWRQHSWGIKDEGRIVETTV